jgi:hypothetical protein
VVGGGLAVVWGWSGGGLVGVVWWLSGVVWRWSGMVLWGPIALLDEQASFRGLACTHIGANDPIIRLAMAGHDRAMAMTEPWPMTGPWPGHRRAMAGPWPGHGRAMGGPWPWQAMAMAGPCLAMTGPWLSHGRAAGPLATMRGTLCESRFGEMGQPNIALNTE